MPQYLVANYLPDDFDPSAVTEAMIEEIHALNREMIAAGARKFACGISPASNAKTVRKQPDGRVLVTDGPYTETKEHMGGFWILECADINEALAWAKKAAIVCDVAGEVRELLFFPAPKKRSSRTSPATSQTMAAFFAHASASLISAHSSIQNPPMCSLVSVYGPSVTSTLPSGCFRSVFALAAAETPQANFLAPTAINSRLSAGISSIIASVRSEEHTSEL